MNTRGAGGKALLGSALLIVLALGGSFWLVAAEQRRLYNEDLTQQLLTAARMLREALRDGWASLDAGGIAGLVHTLRSEGASVIRSSGPAPATSAAPGWACRSSATRWRQ